MSEDVKSYVQRIRGYLGDRNPMEILSSTPGVLAELIRQRKTEEWQESRNDKWSNAHILAHLTEGEIVFGYRIRMIVSEPGASIQGYDQNKWMGRAAYLFDDPEKTLALFQNLRSTNIAFLKSLSQEAWDFYGVHSERGKETISDLARLTAGHDLNHLKQLR